MSKRAHPSRSDHLRRALAQEAARIMAEHGIRDFLAAKRKAAERYGVTDQAALPKNTEIEAALVEYQRLFEGAVHEDSLHAQRQVALEAMRELGEFSPRLVGPVLSGTATEHAHVELHLFCDSAESVAIKLMDAGIRHEVTEQRFKINGDRSRTFPGVRFAIREQTVNATVFPVDGLRQAPVSPVDGKPMRRANVGELESLLANEKTDGIV